MKKVPQTSIGLPKDIVDWVREEAKRLRCSSAQVVRTLLALEIERRKNSEPK
jgi:hypothetical protein